MGIWAEIKYALNSTLGENRFISLDKMIVINALLSDDEAQNEWAFRQDKIGNVINVAFDLNSSELATCNTVEEIANNSSAISAIGTSASAVSACAKNKMLIQVLFQTLPDEKILAAGLGYLKFNVGDLVTLNYNNQPTQFRVVHKDYLVKDKIVLLSENCVGNTRWGTSNSYSTSTIRSHLNSTILQGFSQDIQNAIVQVPLPCHDYTSATTCNDKIWIPSYTEVNFSGSDYAPDEGSVWGYFNGVGNSARVKTLNGTATYWWLRTPYNRNTSVAWSVKTDGNADGYGVTISYGVAFALII